MAIENALALLLGHNALRLSLLCLKTQNLRYRAHPGPKFVRFDPHQIQKHAWMEGECLPPVLSGGDCELIAFRLKRSAAPFLIASHPKAQPSLSEVAWTLARFGLVLSLPRPLAP